jgi:hypothetical protein
MSSTDFLEQMREAGKDAASGGQGIIGQIKIEFGLHRYVTDHDFWTFWKPIGARDDIDSVEAELIDRLHKAGSNERPNLGVRVTIKKEVLSRDTPYEKDLSEFTTAWQQDGYNLVLDHIESGQLPVGEWFYGRVQYIANPYFVKQGEVGKKDVDQNGNPRFPAIRVPVEKFADEAAARAMVDDSATGDGKYDQLSEKAKASYPNYDIFKLQSEQVLTWYEKALNGEGMPNKPIKDYQKEDGTIDKEVAKIYMADIWQLETGDIELLLAEATPF